MNDVQNQKRAQAGKYEASANVLLRPWSERFVHYSQKPFEFERRTYDQRVDTKPRGLWLSVDDAWLDWCRGENFHLEHCEWAIPVSIREGATVLGLATEEDLDAFTREYRRRPSRARPPYVETNSLLIDWSAVARWFDGIVISPYQWGRRLELPWYYGWDCASGCVWNCARLEFGEPQRVRTD